MGKGKFIVTLIIISVIVWYVNKEKDIWGYFLSQVKREVQLTTPVILQNPELPRGCEVTSLGMMLTYAGVKVDKMTLAKQIKKVPFESNGLRGDLNEGFVGDMYSTSNPGLGVYAKPIAELAATYLPGRVVNLSGGNPSRIYSMLAKGSPVWINISSTHGVLEESEFETWQTKNGPLKVTYHEHSVLVTGYDKENVYVNDPLNSVPNVKIPKQQFEDSWIQMGRQAISYK